MRCWLANKKLHKLNFAKSSSSECHLQTLLPYYTLTHTHTLSHTCRQFVMPWNWQIFVCRHFVVVLFSCPRALGGGGRHFVARVSHVLLLPPLLSSPLLSFASASPWGVVCTCLPRPQKKAGGRAPKQRVSKQQAQQKQLLKRSYRWICCLINYDHVNWHKSQRQQLLVFLLL